ncbi:WecB/TagA/CpsF family glycosyltransferase [Planococcus glaciei]|uniref:WecB/TagA/CpsF family glycosyltransferase n=1 Tax=Planococcus glaciei TaxID=459472 RepID=UPI001C737BF6|nr:WecB/TagA/CpsF family glycosyltransferase [Planococcus glaciei]MBX0316835.1 WecB/TagA/CpsF family glycosyltransferase [Planococcus glaciei]
MKERFFGVEVNTEGYDELIQKIFSRIQSNEKSFIVAINPEKLMAARNDDELRKILQTADFQIPDGVGVLLASRMRKGKIRERVTGIDMMETLCRKASETGESIFLYGGKKGIAEKAAEALQKKYPTLKVAGIIDGYEKDIDYIREKVDSSGASIMFVALGSPRQEKFIINEMNQLHPSVYQGVGGSFDVFAGNVKRAPALFRKFGLEWLYRLICEPFRWKRQLALPKFLFAILKERKKMEGF